eukprot:scaffold1211_cov337-Prasinococcus_capsulatus_cf.AAC.3
MYGHTYSAAPSPSGLAAQRRRRRRRRRLRGAGGREGGRHELSLTYLGLAGACGQWRPATHPYPPPPRAERSQVPARARAATDTSSSRFDTHPASWWGLRVPPAAAAAAAAAARTCRSRRRRHASGGGGRAAPPWQARAPLRGLSALAPRPPHHGLPPPPRARLLARRALTYIHTYVHARARLYDCQSAMERPCSSGLCARGQ